MNLAEASFTKSRPHNGRDIRLDGKGRRNQEQMSKSLLPLPACLLRQRKTIKPQNLPVFPRSKRCE